MMQPFIWGQGGEKVTPQEAARQRQMAEALMGQNSTIADNPWEGIAQVARSFTGTQLNNRAAEAERIGQEEAAALFGQLDPTSDLSSIMTAAQNPWASDTQRAIAEMLMQQEMQEMDPLRQLQIQAAQQGVDLGAIELEQARNPAPVLPEAPKTATIYDPETGRDQVVQWNPLIGDWEPVGGVQAPKDPLVQVNTGDGAPGLGKLSTDYGYVLDPATGEPVIDPATGLPTAAAVPGSPAALEAQRLLEAGEAGAAQTERYGNVVTEEIDRALGLLEEDPTWTTGILGQVMGNLKGSNADRLQNLINTVKANSAFDRLQAMRDASPTGGALGAVSAPELLLLESAIGSLERSDPEDLAYNLKRVQQIYDEIINGPQSSRPQQNQSTVDANDIDALLELYQ